MPKIALALCATLMAVPAVAQNRDAQPRPTPVLVDTAVEAAAPEATSGTRKAHALVAALLIGLGH